MSKLDELERLSKAATPGDWDPNIYGSLFFLTHPTERKFPSSTDLELIAAMRNNIDQLIEIAKAASYLVKYHDLTDGKVAVDVLRMHVNRLERGE